MAKCAPAFSMGCSWITRDIGWRIMGIRFYCPNGHKLNVKGFQAGRRGICPYCGVGVDIPTESVRPSSKELRDKHAYPLAPDPSQTSPPGAEPPQKDMAPSGAEPPPEVLQPIGPVSGPLTAEPSQAGNVAYPDPPDGATSANPPDCANPTDQPVASPGSPPVSLFDTPLPAETSTPVAPSAPSAAGSPVPPSPSVPNAPPVHPALEGEAASAPDPIVEDPNAVWYVRPASGGQFGPAGGDVMRGWLDEGRVGPDSLIWREGWDDWRQAKDVFAELGQQATNMSLAALRSADASARTSAAAGHPRQTSRRRSDTNRAVIVVVLVLIVVILFAIFLAVVFSKTGETASATGGRRVDVAARQTTPANLETSKIGPLS